MKNNSTVSKNNIKYCDCILFNIFDKNFKVRSNSELSLGCPMGPGGCRDQS